MYELFPCRVEVFENTSSLVDGGMTNTWSKVNAILDPILGVEGELMCRLDLNFIRAGKDFPMPGQGGVAPDRTGVMFLYPTTLLREGHLIKTVSGPISGTFVLKAIPDPAIDFSAVHHMEVQVFEINQNMIMYPANPVE